mgnify:CR=1 FL=1
MGWGWVNFLEKEKAVDKGVLIVKFVDEGQALATHFTR